MAQRDTTKVLNYVTLALESTDAEARASYLRSAQQILRDIDARETRLEPHLRNLGKRRVTKSPKKA